MLLASVLKKNDMLNLVDKFWNLVVGDQASRLLDFHLLDHFKLLGRY